tara:strand:+ start:430 stop:1053 length:624 start_codon:yes stop_codon:yes gene_type:complete
MSEPSTKFRRKFSNDDAGLYLSEVTENNSKLALALRRIMPSPKSLAQFIGFYASGPLKDGIVIEAPGVVEMICGETPAPYDDGGTGQELAGMWYAENGDIVLKAPRGKIRLDAQNVELVTTGDGQTTGHVLMSASGKIELFAPDVEMVGRKTVGISGNGKGVNINSTGTIQFDCGDFKVIEGTAATDINDGSTTIVDKAKAIVKLLS